MRHAGLLALAVLLAGCSRSGGFGLYAAPPQNGVLAIGPIGATDIFVGGSLGGTSVVVPPNALTQTVTITIGPGTPVQTGDAVLVGPPVLMTPNNQVFLTPVTIDIPYAPAQIPAGKTPSDIVVLVENPSTGAITVLKPTSVNTVGLLVDFTTTMFANFQAAVFDAGPPTITGTSSPQGGSPPVISTAGGQAVTITGTNLFQGATVTFG
ncbi:MAG TPA: hypothetical protein VFF73_36075, partial [Planctomycetota bacterium]|nr:hypothetical protein [Planctomycetota bacterium]